MESEAFDHGISCFRHHKTTDGDAASSWIHKFVCSLKPSSPLAVVQLAESTSETLKDMGGSVTSLSDLTMKTPTTAPR